MGLKVVGVFAACVSKTGDGFRDYEKQLGGYRYYGIYNRVDAVAAAYYSDGQLPLTFHHEIFHHIDATQQGQTASWQLSSDDVFFRAAVSGRKRYPAPTVAADDLAALRDLGRGNTLRGAVSDYAAKNAREDQAETARHLMSALPDSLLQAIEQPNLAGSQRILHILREYEQSVPNGPDFDWFVDVALQRAPYSADQLLARLQRYATGVDGVRDDPSGARKTIGAIARLDVAAISPQQRAELVRLASDVTEALLCQRIQPNANHTRFVIWGQEDANGVNRTLRNDVQQFSTDAARLARVATIDKRQSDLLARTQLKNLRLIARYYFFIAAHWSLTPGTQQVFESARQTISGSLPAVQAALTEALREAELLELGWRITNDGEPRLLPPRRARAG